MCVFVPDPCPSLPPAERCNGGTLQSFISRHLKTKKNNANNIDRFKFEETKLELLIHIADGEPHANVRVCCRSLALTSLGSVESHARARLGSQRYVRIAHADTISPSACCLSQPPSPPSPTPPLHSFAPDIKPENIFLRKSGGRLCAVIGDFGAAAMATRTVSHFFTV